MYKPPELKYTDSNGNNWTLWLYADEIKIFVPFNGGSVFINNVRYDISAYIPYKKFGSLDHTIFSQFGFRKFTRFGIGDYPTSSARKKVLVMLQSVIDANISWINENRNDGKIKELELSINSIDYQIDKLMGELAILENERKEKLALIESVKNS